MHIRGHYCTLLLTPQQKIQFSRIENTEEKTMQPPKL